MKPVLIGILFGVASLGQSGGDGASIVVTIRETGTGEHAIGFRVAAESQVSPGTGASASGVDPAFYELKHLKAGRYRLVVTGFFPSGFRAEIERPVTLVNGQRLTLEVHVPTPGTISGRILQEDGSGARGVRVSLFDKVYSAGEVHLRHIGEANTDESGIYRIGGIPTGRTLIVRADASMGRAQAPADTYFPGVLSPDAAEEIVLNAGQTRTGVDIRRVNQPVYCIDGFVESGPGIDALSWEVSRAVADNDPLAYSPQELPASGETLQKFEICGLHNGRYYVGVQTKNVNGRPLKFPTWSEGSVVVRGGDVHGIRLTSSSPVTISGETLWDAESLTPLSAKVMIHLQGTYRNAGFTVTHRDIDIPRSFSMQASVLPEDYILDTVMISSGASAYVSKVIWNGEELRRNRVSLGGETGGASIRVFAQADGGAITIRVVDAKGKPYSSAFVSIIPATPLSEGDLAAKLIFGRSDQNGTFSAHSIPPGRYRVLPIADLPEGMGEPAEVGIGKALPTTLISALWRSQSRGEVIDIGSKATVQLTVQAQMVR